MSGQGFRAIQKLAALLATVGAILFAWPSLATAQPPPPNPAPNAGPDALGLAQKPPKLPPPPPQGAWGEVIMADAKWLVVQNHLGQQFPIAADSISQFLIRWPTRLDALTLRSWVEVTGNDVGSNILRTDHVDVFEGADVNLVSPTYNYLVPGQQNAPAVDPIIDRFMLGFDMLAMNVFYGWAYPMPAATLGLPVQLHVVGNVVGNNPVRIGLPGNGMITVVPNDPSGLSVTQMTRGNASFAEKGDLVFLMATDMTRRSVVLSQLVLYKKVALKDFRPR